MSDFRDLFIFFIEIFVFAQAILRRNKLKLFFRSAGQNKSVCAVLAVAERLKYEVNLIDLLKSIRFKLLKNIICTQKVRLVVFHDVVD